MNQWAVFSGLILWSVFMYLFGYYMAKTYWQDRGYDDALRHREATIKANTHESKSWRNSRVNAEPRD